jgi:hypothetical protein
MPLPKIEVPKYELTIPSSGKNVKYRPFLVREEKVLLIAMEADDDKQMMNAVKDIITNCVYDEVNVDNMPLFDIEYIFLQLRSKSKGETVDLTFDCEDCKTPITVQIDLSKIEITRKEEHKTEIPLSSDVGIKMKYPSLEIQNLIDEKESDVKNIFNTIIHCIESIWDKENVYAAKDHTPDELNEFLESLPENAFTEIQTFFDTLPTLTHDIIIKCNNKKGKGKNSKVCGWKGTKKLEGLASFFA